MREGRGEKEEEIRCFLSAGKQGVIRKKSKREIKRIQTKWTKKRERGDRIEQPGLYR